MFFIIFSQRFSGMKPARLAARLAASILIAGTSLMPVAGVGSNAQAQEVAAFADSSRLVSVGGALTEIVYALGAGDRLIARDRTSTYPALAKELPDIGYMRQLTSEGVLSVAPSAMLVVEGSGPPETMDVLKRASVPMLVVPDTYTPDGIAEKITMVGEALGLSGEAAALSAKVRGDLQAVATAGAAVKDKKRVLFVLSFQGGRIMASGQGTAADAMIQLAGGINAVEGYQGYKHLTDEALEQAAPDLILMMDTGSPTQNTDQAAILNNPAVAATPAGQSKAVVKMDGLYLLGFGPRTAQAARELSVKLYNKAG